MGRLYSLDLRERVIVAAAATSPRQAAARLGVGIATAIRWAAAVEATGTVAARPQGRPRTSKPNPHEAFLRGLIDRQDGITREEMRARLLAERDLKIGLARCGRFSTRAISLTKKAAHAAE